ncbi:cupin domain-containing protein [Amycolatopsis benzoatilytica]|uniref:cupin domain-containing protein n=1 Tax=Amycolatopsis benzoatilytica TaxID=346045 RepID=UPI0003637113|nr:cupin domain-containing protein [Amycolatopsis benzoatilytica]
MHGNATTFDPVVVASMFDREVVRGLQGQPLAALIDGESAPEAKIGLATVTMGSGHRSRAHQHARTPAIIYIVEGRGTTHHGPRMRPLAHDSRSMVYIPAGVAHGASNQSERNLLAVEARLIRQGTRFNDDVVPMPGLQHELDRAPASTRREFAACAGSRPVRVPVNRDRDLLGGVVPVVHNGVAPVEGLSAGRVRLSPVFGPCADAEIAERTCTGVQPVRRHEASQRILMVLGGKVGLAYTSPGTGFTVRTLSRGHAAWIREGTPYALANLGSVASAAVMFSTDAGFDRDMFYMPDLDRRAYKAFQARADEEPPPPTGLLWTDLSA